MSKHAFQTLFKSDLFHPDNEIFLLWVLLEDDCGAE